MNLDEYASLDATALAALVAAGETTAAELCALARTAGEAVNRDLNAVVEWYDDPRPGGDGPFAGVPFLMKDIGTPEPGRRQWMGSRAVNTPPTTTDSALAQRFRQSGLISVGRTATSEFAITATVETARFGPTRNPWDPARTTGGSSGGAAAAVAAGVVPLAHATDSGGSIRIPAACCGLVGLKPSRGRIPCDGGLGDFNTELVVARTVRDAAQALSAFGGSRPDAPSGSYRIALATESSWLTDVDPAIAAATVSVAHLCEELGHTVEEAAPDIGWPALFDAMKTLWAVGALEAVGEFVDTTADERPDTVEPLTWDWVARARRIGADDIPRALAAVDHAARVSAEFFERFDVLVTPTLPILPPLLGEFSPDLDVDTYYAGPIGRLEPSVAVFNATGQPALTVPAALHDGLPVGVQFIGPVDGDEHLLRLAAQLKPALSWSKPTPPIHASTVASAAAEQRLSGVSSPNI